MEIKITNRIEFRESDNSPKNSFEWSYIGSSEEETKQLKSCGEEVEELPPFKISNVNKFSYELKPGNNFDLCVLKDLIRTDDNACSIHIFCFESDSFKRPANFDLVLDDLNITLATCSEFSIGNCSNMMSDIRICNIPVPEGRKLTLTILVATTTI